LNKIEFKKVRVAEVEFLFELTQCKRDEYHRGCYREQHVFCFNHQRKCDL